ncbi:diguanylate cyclase domain-containing protein [Halanaerobium saccharolyticum]|uniref:sensor domain-containing diguanylate cyclase/phosphohydrolase n=1 Tax=Halanaerobium saccharolyticum TaxID=43595 RepID=UPI003FCCD8DC
MNFLSTLELGFTYIYTAAFIIFALGIFLLYQRNKRIYLWYFTVFAVLSFLANAVDILYYYYNFKILYFFYAIFILFEAYYLLKAVHTYFSLELDQFYLRSLKFLVFILILSSLSLNRFVIFAPALLFLAAAFFKSGEIFFNQAFNNYFKFAGANSWALGTIVFFLPYLRFNSYFEKYGIFLKGLFALLFMLSIFAIYYEDLQYRLKIREEQYQKLFNQSPAGMLLLDKDGTIITVNDSICQYTGYSREELEGESMFKNLVPIEYKIRAQKNIQDILNGEDKEYIMKTYDKKNKLKYFLMKETKFIQSNFRTAILSMRIDYTDYKIKEEKIKYLSYHDNLTDLYNRTFMEEEMKRLNDSRRLPISVIMIDVNGLKLFNDTFGHQKGDQLLIKTAEILKKSTRASDLIARWAGDEFAILLPSTSKKDMKKIINRIQKNCEQTNKDQISISLALGAAIKNEENEDLFEIFELADKRMYQQKMSQGKKAKRKLISNILLSLAEKSHEDSFHIQRLKEKAADFADYLKLKSSEKNKLIELAELHDIGKISISEKILNKKGKLNKKEWEKIKKHSEVGYKIAAASKEFASLAKLILHHHENWDGSGYPEGLKKEEIPYLARIISIIDAYDVMLNKNLYSKKMNKKEAIEELNRAAGSQFDPALTAEFINFIE